MILKKEYVYSSQEVAEYFNLHIKKVTRLAKKHNIKKVGKGYEFSGEFLMKYFKMDETDNVRKVSLSVPEVSVKKTFQEHLKSQPFKPNNKIIEENEALKLEIKLLKAKLSEFDLKDNERIEIFTNEMYQVFEKRLLEWTTQKQAIEQQDRLERELNQKLIISDITIRSKREELTLHKDNAAYYKAQAEYKDKQNNKLTASFDKLIETIATQSKDMFTKTAIEAKKTEWTKKK